MSVTIDVHLEQIKWSQYTDPWGTPGTITKEMDCAPTSTTELGSYQMLYRDQKLNELGSYQMLYSDQKLNELGSYQMLYRDQKHKLHPHCPDPHDFHLWKKGSSGWITLSKPLVVQ